MVEIIDAIHVTEAVEEEEDEENEDIIEADIVTSSSGHLNVTPVEQSRSRSGLCDVGVISTRRECAVYSSHSNYTTPDSAGLR